MYDHYSFQDATAYQIELAKQLRFEQVNQIETIAGADISFNKYSTTMYATIVMLTYPAMVLKSFALATYETNFPYKPGFLEVIKNCIGNYRIPEPTRQAHNIVNDFRTGKLKAGFHEVLPDLTLF